MKTGKVVAMSAGGGAKPPGETETFSVAKGDPKPSDLFAHRFTEHDYNNVHLLCQMAMMKNGGGASIVMSFPAELGDAEVLARYLLFPSVDGPVRILRRGDVGNVVVPCAAFCWRLVSWKAVLDLSVEHYADLKSKERAVAVAAQYDAMRKGEAPPPLFPPKDDEPPAKAGPSIVVP